MIAILGAVAWEIFRPHEPMYDGKPLSYWLEGYAVGKRTETSVQASDHALQAIGTNAIPYLLSMLRQKDSPLKLRLIDLARKQNVFKFSYLDEVGRVCEAGSGLKALRSDARSAVPDLIQILSTDHPEITRWVAATTLGGIGPSASNAVPALAASLTNRADSMRSYAIFALGRIHSVPGIAVPALAGCLKGARFGETKEIAEALGKFGSDAKPAVMSLMEAARNSGHPAKQSCLDALQKIDPQAAAELEAELKSQQQ